MNKKRLDEILKKHKQWLMRDGGANANLQGADLRRANLQGADLRGADLRWADLQGTDLRGADLQWADLREANLRWANLQGTDLRGAYIAGAKLADAIIDESTLIYLPLACPDTGEFIGWKKASDKIVCLKIPKNAKRSSATSRKCRCDKAKVISIQNLDGTDSELTEIRSDHDHSFIYEVGKTVKVNDFCEDRWKECAPGIHFFITREEAVRY